MLDVSLTLELLSTGILAEIARRMGSMRSDVDQNTGRIENLEGATGTGLAADGGRR